MDAMTKALIVGGGITGLAAAMVLSRLGIMTMGLTDTIVVGRYSPQQLSYHALA